MAGHRTWSLKIAAASASLVLSVTAAELLLHLADIDLNPNPNWRFHPTLGWTQERDRVYEIVIDDATVRVEFNSAGFRDREHSVEPSAGTKRIAVIGDSFSEAIQVNLEETWWWQLGQILEARTGHSWEVINLGVGDFGTTQEYLVLRDYGLRYKPDLVVLQIFPLNDICNNAIDLAHLCRSVNDAFRPYLIASGEAPAIGWTQPRLHWLRSRSYLAGVVENLARRFTTGVADHEQLIRAAGLPSDPLVNTFAPTEHQFPGIAAGWAATETLIREIDALCRRSGTELAGVVIPFHARVEPVWSDFAARQPVELIQDYPEQRLGALFAELGRPATMLLETFQANPGIFFPDRGGHLNPAAHRLAAERVADDILAASEPR